MKNIYLFSIALFISLGLNAQIGVDSVGISQKNINLTIDQTFKLVETVYPFNAENKVVTWNSSDEEVVTVENGIVTALAPGNAVIKVITDDGELENACEVIVSSDLSSLELIFADYEGFIPNQWVNGNGSIVYNPGIEAPNESAKVFKYEKPDGAWMQYLVHLQDYNISRSALKSFSFQVYNGADAAELKAYMIKVITQNQDAGADVDWQTDITLEPGWNTVTYTPVTRVWTDRVNSVEIYPNMESADSGIFYFDNFLINYSLAPVAVTGIEISDDTLEMLVGDDAFLSATVAPENAANNNYAWSSSDEEVAVVDFWGMVTAVGTGTATITATTEDGDFKAFCEVTVNELVSMSSIASERASIYPNPFMDGNLTIKTGDRDAGAATVRIVNLAGALVYAKKYTYSRGEIVLTPSLPKGVYMVHVSTSGKTIRQLLTVQ